VTVAFARGTRYTATAQFCAYTGSVPMPEKDRRLGDALMDGRPVELKEAGAGGKKDVAQVRAVAFVPLVVRFDHVAGPSDWYVLSAVDVVRIASTRKGHHCRNPFECCILREPHITGDSHFGPYEPEALLAAVRAALAEGDRHPELRAKMEEMRAEIEETASRMVDDVRELLHDRTSFQMALPMEGQRQLSLEDGHLRPVV
jgi:hypothetical protein